MGRLSRLFWRALVGGLFLGLLTGALLSVQAPVLTVEDAKAGRHLLDIEVRPKETFSLSYRHSVTQDMVSGTFEVDADGSFWVKETTFRSPGPGLPEPRPGEEYEISGGLIRYRPSGQRLEELSVFIHPFTEHAIHIRGKSLNISQAVRQGALVKIRVEWRSPWRRWGQKMGALLSRAR